jgi:hypothetical protein
MFICSLNLADNAFESQHESLTCSGGTLLRCSKPIDLRLIALGVHSCSWDMTVIRVSPAARFREGVPSDWLSLCPLNLSAMNELKIPEQAVFV